MDPGTLDGLVNAQIRAPVTGYLLKQNYREGDPIEERRSAFLNQGEARVRSRPRWTRQKACWPRRRRDWARRNLTLKRYEPLVKR